MAKTPLSSRAEKLLQRVREGKFYFAYDAKTPKAMQELIDAKLVGTAGRAVVLRACFVPVGFKSRSEIYPAIRNAKHG